MAFDIQGYRQAAREAGIPNEIVEQTIAEKGGVRGWLSNGKSGLGGVLAGAGNVLNLPSYAIGGVLNQAQRATGGKYGQETGARGTGIVEGIRNKRAVMTELPETFGVDPNSTAGRVIGFGGELLTPDPLGMATDLYKGIKGAGAVSDVAKASDAGLFARGARKAGGVKDDVARTLLEKSYKLNKTDIDRIADAIGVTDEAKKAEAVIDYLEGLGLQGATRGSLRKLGQQTDEAQKIYNDLVRRGGQVSRQDYANALLNRAMELEKVDDTVEGRNLVNRLLDEAEYQYQNPRAFTDAQLADTKTSAFSRSSKQAIQDPAKSTFNEQLGRAGVETLEKYAPGSQGVGKRLRGLRTAQERLGGATNKGLGTQLLNAFKPSATGAGAGALFGVTGGFNPIASSVVGAGAGIAANNPRVMNIAGKTLSKKPVRKAVKATQNLPKFVKKGIKKTPRTAFRVSKQPKTDQGMPQVGRRQRKLREEVEQATYTPNNTPQNTQIQLFSDRKKKKRRIF